MRAHSCDYIGGRVGCCYHIALHPVRTATNKPFRQSKGRGHESDRTAETSAPTPSRQQPRLYTSRSMISLHSQVSLKLISNVHFSIKQ